MFVSVVVTKLTVPYYTKVNLVEMTFRKSKKERITKNVSLSFLLSKALTKALLYGVFVGYP